MIYSAIGTESLRIAQASNSFFIVIKILITRMGRQLVSIEKINSVILKVFNKH